METQAKRGAIAGAEGNMVAPRLNRRKI